MRRKRRPSTDDCARTADGGSFDNGESGEHDKAKVSRALHGARVVSPSSDPVEGSQKRTYDVLAVQGGTPPVSPVIPRQAGSIVPKNASRKDGTSVFRRSAFSGVLVEEAKTYFSSKLGSEVDEEISSAYLRRLVDLVKILYE